MVAQVGPSQLPPPVDLAERLRRNALDMPEHTALVTAGGRVTYGELDRRADVACAALASLGVARGDRVALVLGTSPTFVELMAGIFRAGAVLVPLLPALAPDELRHALADSGASVAVCGPERLEALEALRAALPALRHLVAADLGDVPSPEGVERWEGLGARAVAPQPEEHDPDDLAALVYTSGTTGRPRGAMLTRRNLAANQDQSLAGRFEVGAQDVVLLVLPLAHIYALNVGLGASLAAGATVVLVERFEPASALRAILDHDANVILGAPGMYVAWLASEELPTAELAGRIRLAVSGAAPLPIPVFDRFRELTGVTIEEGYGLTEAAPSVASNAMGDHARAGSVGLPLPGIELRVVGDDRHDVLVGDPGEIWVRGPNVFRGYFGDPDATSEALTGDGWLRTGDIATQDEDGYLYLVDRRKDLILVNGFNVYPREVERVLEDDAAVLQAAVIGVPHPLTGETVAAYVVPRPGHEVGVEGLLERCRRDLARYKCPSRVEVVPELPSTATGKIRRTELRDEQAPSR